MTPYQEGAERVLSILIDYLEGRGKRSVDEIKELRRWSRECPADDLSGDCTTTGSLECLEWLNDTGVGTDPRRVIPTEYQFSRIPENFGIIEG